MAIWSNRERESLVRPMENAALPRPAVLLGLAGIVPQALCFAAALVSIEWQWVALAAACFYAALILSFLGGLWWMQLLLQREERWRPWLLSVAASLGGWAALLPWCLGWTWPGPSLVALGALLVMSPLVDRHLAGPPAPPAGWLGLRARMAGGLGLLTLLLGLAAPFLA